MLDACYGPSIQIFRPHFAHITDVAAKLGLSCVAAPHSHLNDSHPLPLRL
jgi:hypothetical protein